MLKFTLDTNCLIDVDERRDSAPSIQLLLDAAARTKADVAMVVSSASERQRSGGFLDNLETFRVRMQKLGFGEIELLLPLLRWDIGFWDAGLWADANSAAREALIYKTLFPASAPEWTQYAAASRVDPDDRASGAFARWRNQILDAQAFWAHEFNGRDIFVTSDKQFRRLEGHPSFPAAIIRDPKGATALL